LNELTTLIQGNDAFLRAALSIPPHLLGNDDSKRASSFVIWKLLDCLGAAADNGRARKNSEA